MEVGEVLDVHGLCGKFFFVHKQDGIYIPTDPPFYPPLQFSSGIVIEST